MSKKCTDCRFSKRVNEGNCIYGAESGGDKSCERITMSKWQEKACGFCRHLESFGTLGDVKCLFGKFKIGKYVHLKEFVNTQCEVFKNSLSEPKLCKPLENRPAEKPKEEVEKKCETCNNNHNKTSRCYASEDPAIECLLRDYILWHPKGVRDWGYEKYVHVSDPHSFDIITLEGVWFKNKAIVDQIYNSFYEQEEIELPYTGEGKIRGTIFEINDIEKVHTRWYCKKIKILLTDWQPKKEPKPDPVRDCDTCTQPCYDIPYSERKGCNGNKGCNSLTNLYMYEAKEEPKPKGITNCDECIHGFKLNKGLRITCPSRDMDVPNCGKEARYFEAKSCESCKYLKGGIGNRPCGECNKNRDKWEAKEPTETTLCEICKYKCKYAKKTKCEYFTDENLCKECIRKKCRDCFGGIHFEPKEPRTCKECEQCSMYDMIKKRCRYDYKKIYDSCPKSKKVVLCRNCKYYDWNESKNYWNSCLCTKLTKYTTDFSKGCEGFKPREKTVEKHTCSICKHHSTHFRKCIHGQAGIFRSIDHEDVKECRFLVVKETTVEVNQEFVFSTPHQSEMWEIMKEQLDLQKKELKQQKEMYKEMANTVPTRYWTGQRVKLVNNNKANKVEIIGGIEPMEDIKKEIERVKEEYKKEQERTKKIEDTRKEFIKTVIIAEDMDLLKKLKDQRYFLKEELLTFLDLKKKERKIAKTFYYYSYNNIDGEMRRGYLVRDDTDGTYLYALDDRKEWDTVKKILQEIKDKKDLWRLSLEQDKLYDLVERNCRRAKCPDIYKEEKEDVCDCKKYIRKKSVFCPRCGLPICPNCRETLEMGEFECKICGWVK